MNAKLCKMLRKELRAGLQIKTQRARLASLQPKVAALRAAYNEQRSDYEWRDGSIRLVKLCPRAIYQRTKGVLRSASARVS